MTTSIRSRHWCLAVVAALALPLTATASETEMREFIIEVDGKPAGQYAMTITKQDDGVLSMAVQAGLTVKHLLGTYAYSFEGVEHWKDGRLIQLNGKCVDDGKKTETSAVAEAKSLKVTVNGKARSAPWDSWTTSYWKLADQRFHNQKIPLLDCDTGKEFLGNLQYVGVEPVTVGGQQQNCYHFRVTGGPTTPVELWYDGQHRLVRQEFTDQGKRVAFNLRSVRR